MVMMNPLHPGLSVKHDCLEPLGLSVTKGAEILGVTSQTLNDLVHGRRGISPEMALPLVGSNPLPSPLRQFRHFRGFRSCGEPWPKAAARFLYSWRISSFGITILCSPGM